MRLRNARAFTPAPQGDGGGRSPFPSSQTSDMSREELYSFEEQRHRQARNGIKAGICGILFIFIGMMK